MTKPLVEDGKLVVVAVAQEQHAERTRLYQQWKKLDWPILQDAFCEMRITAVPLAIAIDEQGRVASHRVNSTWLKKWCETTSSKVETESKSPRASSERFAASVVVGDLLMKFPERNSDVNTAITNYTHALTVRDDAAVHFRLGVAFRKRFDLFGDEQDFRLAEKHWTKSLEMKPNQYIFRRRIEQYGPRLMKPYPFYDWVEQAIADINARGETPRPLKVRLSGSEIAARVASFGGVTGDVVAPDPEGKIIRGTDLISVSSIVVPGKISPGKSARVHISMKPNDGVKWNNESSEPQIWIETQEGIEVTHRLIQLKQPAVASSQETRTTELEIKLNKTYSGKEAIKCYVLFNACKSDDGICMYRRKDFEITFEVKSR